jgi:diguanylate cyclase (GGDEF)-like protein/PAS domain S-box-containing protein
VGVDDVSQAVAALVAAVAGALAARRSSGPVRRGWALLAAGAGLCALGDMSSTVAQLGERLASHPGSIANLGAVVALPLEMGAAVYLSIGPRRCTTVLRDVLDGLLIAISLVFVGFCLFIGRAQLSRHATGPTIALSLAHPVGDVLVAAALFLALSLAMGARRRNMLLWLGLGVAAITLTDFHYSVASLVGTYRGGAWQDAGWPLGFLFIAIATLWAGRDGDEPDRPQGPLQAMVPYLFLGAAVGAASYYFVEDSAPSPFIRWGGVATITIAGLGLIVYRKALVGMVRQTSAAEIVLREHRSRLHQAERHWQLAFDHSPIGTALIDPDGTLARCNQSLADMLDRAPADLQGKPFAAVAQPGDAAILAGLFSDLAKGRSDSCVIEHDFRRRDGSVLSAHLEVAVIRDFDGSLQRMVAQVQDIGDRRRAEQARAYDALHDGLTGLPNNVFLENQISELLRVGRSFGVAYCDLNRFKTVNDSLGRAAGDELLRDVAQRLSTSLPGRCTVGRAVGNEFVLICLGSASVEDLQSLAAGVVSALAEPFNIRGHRHALGVSIGVTSAHPWHRHPDEVLREAHEAMVRAKARGRGRVEVYDPTQDNPATVADLELEDALRESLARGSGIVAHFQPIVRLRDRTVAGHEALARWRHPVKGLLHPAAFLPLAEHTGLVVPLGWQMLEAGCAALRSAAVEGGPSTWMSVNISGSQLGRGQLVPAVRQAVEMGGVDPSRLHLEITETALVHATRAVLHELSEVRRMGAKIALDDFGTGYSSLSMLRDLPVGAVKIDRSFVEPLARDRGTTVIVHRLIELCRDLGIDCIAEGIETEAQAELLHGLGCTYGQGYLFGRPAEMSVTQAS